MCNLCGSLSFSIYLKKRCASRQMGPSTLPATLWAWILYKVRPGIYHPNANCGNCAVNSLMRTWWWDWNRWSWSWNVKKTFSSYVIRPSHAACWLTFLISLKVHLCCFNRCFQLTVFCFLKSVIQSFQLWVQNQRYSFWVLFVHRNPIVPGISHWMLTVISLVFVLMVRWIWVSQYQNASLWISLALRIMEVVVTAGAVRLAKLQSNRHHQ